MFNALTFDGNIEKKKCFSEFTSVFYAGDRVLTSSKIECFKVVSDGFEGKVSGNVFLESLFVNDKLLDSVIENYLVNHGKIIINLANTLDEVGTMDKKYGFSSVFYAEKLGILDNAFLTGCVYLDKDDIELINQHNAEIILTPSTTMGKGYGIPPVRMMETLGAKVHLGTGLEKFNPKADLIFEKDLILLAVSGTLCSENALSERMLNNMIK